MHKKGIRTVPLFLCGDFLFLIFFYSFLSSSIHCRMTWMTRSVGWYLSAQPPTRPSPCSSSWPKLSRETSLRLPWRRMKKWWVAMRGWWRVLLVVFIFILLISLFSMCLFKKVLCSFSGHRNQAEILWHDPCSNSHVCPEDWLLVCVFRIWKPVSLLSALILLCSW